MQITKEFLQSEVAHLEREIGKASEFLIRAQAAIETHKMLMERLEKPEEPEQPVATFAELGLPEPTPLADFRKQQGAG